MDRVDTRSGNEEGGAPEMVESNPTPYTNPTTKLPLYFLAISSSPTGPKGSPPKSTQTEEEEEEDLIWECPFTQTEEEEEEDSIWEYPFTQTEEEQDAIWRAIEEENEKEGQRVFPIFLEARTGEPAQLAIEYYKKKEGVQLRLTEMIDFCDELTHLGLITHLQFKASSCGEPSDAPPKTVYAEIHTPADWCRCKFEKAHASRVFTDESPLLKDPRFQVDPTDGWIDYPFDCSECGLDFLDGPDGFKGLQL